MKKSMVFAAAALFLVQSNLCLAAPSECKEPGAPKGCFEKSAASVPMVLTPDPAFPIRPDIGELVANSPFFRLPSGDYAPFESHSVKNDGKSTSEDTTSLARVAGSPLCRSSNDSISSTGNSSKWISKIEYLSWAGLIRLSSRTSQINQFAPSTSTTQVTRLDKLIGQPFPLKAGNTFSLEVTYENVMSYHKTPDKPEKVTTSASVGQYTCQVGATEPASVVQAGLKGSATALACTVTRQGSLSGTPVAYHWLDSVGCFVLTPKP